MHQEKSTCCPQRGSSSDVSIGSTSGSSTAIVLTYLCSTLHGLMGIMSIILGVLSSRKSEVWMAHRVSPIWSGAFVSSKLHYQV
ncbi:hypothetical protein EB796_017335 [Bugula neritina]|uniref:Uncharacterized protein n=1 Tax=Bugula neritina TaxID=10212 RepID=A0A7J7JFD1_BUGNE|nr:hypothetical protein EB796_017335 [Bugula neritina]